MERVQTTTMMSKVGNDKRRYTIYSFNSNTRQVEHSGPSGMRNAGDPYTKKTERNEHEAKEPRVERSRPVGLRNAGDPYTKDMMWMKRPAEVIAGDQMRIEYRTQVDGVGGCALEEEVGTQVKRTDRNEHKAKEPQVERSRPVDLRNAGDPYTKDTMWMKRPAEVIAGDQLRIEYRTERSGVLKEQTQADEVRAGTLEEEVGTRSKKMEQNEHEAKGPQVWIPSIYRRDILSFLPRTKIENVVRFVSQRWNFVVERYHRMLPRLVFDQFQVHIMGGAEGLVDSDGYACGLSDLWGDAFQELENFRGCCEDIKKPAEQVLTHQLIFPKLRANAVVVLRVNAGWRPRTKFAKSAVEFACRNRLTRTTAGELIHFLSHLDDSAFQRVWVRLDASISGMRSVRGHLNPYIFTVYARATGERLRLNAKVLDVTRWSEARPANAATVRTARQLFSRIGCLSSPFTDKNLDWILNLTEQRAHFRDGVEFFEEGDVVFSNAVDRIINHFDLSKASAKSVVPKVHFHLSAQRHQWPAMCPRKEASEVVRKRDEWGGEDGGAVHIFRRKNLHTGRHFLLRIETSIDPFGEEEMCALKILHNRCVPAG